MSIIKTDNFSDPVGKAICKYNSTQAFYLLKVS